MSIQIGCYNNFSTSPIGRTSNFKSSSTGRYVVPAFSSTSTNLWKHCALSSTLPNIKEINVDALSPASWVRFFRLLFWSSLISPASISSSHSGPVSMLFFIALLRFAVFVLNFWYSGVFFPLDILPFLSSVLLTTAPIDHMGVVHVTIKRTCHTYTYTYSTYM